MDLRQALSQLDAIHAQVSRTETFRGYRPVTVGFQGVLAIGAAMTQSIWLQQPSGNVSAYLQLWVGVAVIAVTVVSLDLLLDCWRSPSQFARRQTLQAIEQFLPCIIAGGSLTAVLVWYAPSSLPLLPGLWSIMFSLGVFSASRQLPWQVVFVAAWYLIAGLAVVAVARGPYAFSPWGMAGTFGLGQLLTAFILHQYRERERTPSHG
jgi:hypothetical protein